MHNTKVADPEFPKSTALKFDPFKSGDAASYLAFSTQQTLKTPTFLPPLPFLPPFFPCYHHFRFPLPSLTLLPSFHHFYHYLPSFLQAQHPPLLKSLPSPPPPPPPPPFRCGSGGCRRGIEASRAGPSRRPQRMCLFQ
jgi:hypothetical protein